MKWPKISISAPAGVLFDSIKISVKEETTETKGNVQVKKMRKKTAEIENRNGVVTKKETDSERTTITLL